MTKVPAYYICGPMSGIPKFNVPLFRSATDLLRKLGMEIISPVELDSDAVYRACMRSKDGKFDAGGKLGGETWGDMLARDVKIVADQAAGVVVLDGWQKSRGARLEVFTALLSNKPIFKYVGDRTPDMPIVVIPSPVALAAIYDSTMETMA